MHTIALVRKAQALMGAPYFVTQDCIEKPKFTERRLSYLKHGPLNVPCCSLARHPWHLDLFLSRYGMHTACKDASCLCI